MTFRISSLSFPSLDRDELGVERELIDLLDAVARTRGSLLRSVP